MRAKALYPPLSQLIIHLFFPYCNIIFTKQPDKFKISPARREETESSMTNAEFVDAVKKRLTDRGLSKDFIDAQCEKLLTKINDLPEETARKYASESNVELIAGKIAEKFSSEGNARKAPQSESPAKTRTVDMSHTQDGSTIGQVHKKNSSSSDMIVISDANNRRKKQSSLPFSISFGDGIASDNDHPVLLFAALLALLAPVGIMVVGISFVVFLTVFMALAAAIILMVAVIIGVVGAGSLVSVASLLSGAVGILSVPRFAGMHEIGFGLLIAGITIFVSVILYNIALRLVPFIYAKLITFITFSARKVKEIFIKAKKGCENL